MRRKRGKAPGARNGDFVYTAVLQISLEELAADRRVSPSSCRLLDAHGRSLPEMDWTQMQRFIMTAEHYLTRPIIRWRLYEMVAYIALLGLPTLEDRLKSIVRARPWEALQLNPWNDVPLLLDCYLAAVSLGESNSHHLALAESTIEEIARRMAKELKDVTNSESSSL